MKSIRSLLVAVIAALAFVSFPAVAGGQVLLNGVTATGTGNEFYIQQANRTFEATVTGTGAVSATVVVEGSDDGVGWVTLGTLTLSGTTSASDGFAILAPWSEVRGDVTAITSGDSVTLTMGAQ